MAVARVTEITASSPNSFDDAVRVGLERANKTLDNVEGAWVKDMTVTWTPPLTSRVERFRA